jgi:hypothetical protein
MANPNTSGIPGMGAMNDTFDFMKNLWSGMGMPGLQGMKIPGMVMPTLSVEEINKQIKDLKSVEAWLTMNLSMLRSTIQALEVQSATITAIQSMGASLAEAIKPAAKPEQPAKKDKPAFESPFASEAERAQEKPPEAAAEKTEAPAGAAGESSIPDAGESTAPLIPPMANPAAWWGVLQEQFKQAVDTAAAMAPDMPAAAAKLVEGVQSSQPVKQKETKTAKSAASQTTARPPAKSKKK